MKIHEYQAKEILKKYGIPVPRGIPAFTVEDALKAAQGLGGTVWVIKAQIHAGGRGKGGGVKVARSMDEVKQYAEQILGMQLITRQTGSQGQKVRRLLIEQGVEIQNEYYLGMLIDRASQKTCVMASSAGGMNIEEVAAQTPEKIHKIYIDPVVGLSDAQAEQLLRAIEVPETSWEQGRTVLQRLYQCFNETDADLLEVNPLITTREGRVMALDAKMTFDDNALYRHPEIVEMRDLDEEDAAEIEASKYGLSYISLDGDIGCLVNGAGLAMATMDSIKLYGGAPANFLDVGGGASVEKVTEAFKIMLKNPQLKAILVNIFGGIMRCDVIADGVVTAAKQVQLKVPLVVRMKGTNEAQGKKILADSGLPIIAADTMAEAAERVVAAAHTYEPLDPHKASAESGQWMSNAAAGALGTVSAVGAGVLGAVGTVGEKVAEVTGKTAQGVVSLTGEAVEVVGDIAGGTVEAAKAVATGTIDLAGGAVEKVGEVASNTVGLAKDVVVGATGLGASSKASEVNDSGVMGLLKRYGWLLIVLALLLLWLFNR